MRMLVVGHGAGHPASSLRNQLVDSLRFLGHEVVQAKATGDPAVDRDRVAAALERYQSDRYLPTARVQLTSRFYGEVFHLSGAAADLRNYLLGDRSLDDTYKGMAWLYSGVDDTGGQIMDPNRPGPTRHPASE